MHTTPRSGSHGTGDATWTLSGGRVLGPAPFLIAGILNLTPDSFSDGGSWTDPQKAVAHAKQLWADGAHMLDVGAESTRPGSDFVSADEEIARLRPALSRIIAERENWPDPTISKDEAGAATAAAAKALMPPDYLAAFPYPLLSVDTWRASTAAAVLEMGVEIINDISGGSFDPAMDEVAANYSPGFVLMHCPAPPKTMQAAPAYTNVVDEVMAFFESRMHALTKAGLPESRISLDPGIGFGKNLEHNLELMRNIARMKTLGRPLYFGISRKGFFGKLLNIPLAERDTATQILTALFAAQNAYVHRVHDVAGTARALALAEAVQAVV